MYQFICTDSFYITHSNNHWLNEKIGLEYLYKVIFPLVEQKRKELKLDQDANALLLFDVFKEQTTPAVIDLLHNFNCNATHVPNNYTNLFQPVDIFVNKSAKCFLAAKYQDCYANEALRQLTRRVKPYDVKVDVALTNINRLHANQRLSLFKII